MILEFLSKNQGLFYKSRLIKSLAQVEEGFLAEQSLSTTYLIRGYLTTLGHNRAFSRAEIWISLSPQINLPLTVSKSKG